MEHQIKTPAECNCRGDRDRGICPICDWGFSVCKVCGEAEGGLAPECPGPKRKPMEADMVEIARSFSYKLNTGNYQSQDFFCSQKKQCKEADAEKVSEALYAFCVREVMKGVKAAIADMSKVRPGF